MIGTTLQRFCNLACFHPEVNISYMSDSHDCVNMFDSHDCVKTILIVCVNVDICYADFSIICMDFLSQMNVIVIYFSYCVSQV